MVTQRSAEPEWLKRARADAKSGEKSKEHASARMREMCEAVGRGEVNPAMAICGAAGVGSWLKDAGQEIPEPEVALTPAAYETYGKALPAFRPGAICAFYYGRGREADARRHVAIGVSEGRTHYECIGIINGLRVTTHRFPKRDLTAMRWPEGRRSAWLKPLAFAVSVAIVTAAITFSLAHTLGRDLALNVCAEKIAGQQRKHDVEVARIAALATAECTVVRSPPLIESKPISRVAPRPAPH